MGNGFGGPGVIFVCRTKLIFFAKMGDFGGYDMMTFCGIFPPELFFFFFFDNSFLIPVPSLPFFCHYSLPIPLSHDHENGSSVLYFLL